MYRIYYGNKLFYFAAEPHLDGSPYEWVGTNNVPAPAKLLQIIGNSNSLGIISSDPGKTFNAFCDQMSLFEAGGGVIENAAGEILMIHRRGVWDLPKGHLEAMETHEEAAVRECEEETGLEGLKVKKYLTTTQHFYNTFGLWEIKRTRWYSMYYPGDSAPMPQQAEDITEARWVKGAELFDKIAQSYATIREVVGEYLHKG